MVFLMMNAASSYSWRGELRGCSPTRAAGGDRVPQAHRPVHSRISLRHSAMGA